MKLKSIKHKFGAHKCQRGEIKFSSKLERSVHDLLTSLKESGKLLFFLSQVPIRIGGGHKYLLDFMVFTPTDCYFFFVLGRGIDLPLGKLKRHQAEEILGVEIHVVTDSVQVFGVISQ